MSESFRKIVRIVFELRALAWGWDGDGRDVVPISKLFLSIDSDNISLSIHKTEKKSQEQYPF